jgi:hypothetical protein
VRQEGGFNDTKTGSRGGVSRTSGSSKKGATHNAQKTSGAAGSAAAAAAAGASGGVEGGARGCWLLARAKLVHPNFSQVRRPG